MGNDKKRVVEVFIAGTGGAAHLPGMCASQTVLPVLGDPVQSKALNGMDSLLSIVQMPAGIPVGMLAIGGREKRRAFGNFNSGELPAVTQRKAASISSKSNTDRFRFGIRIITTITAKHLKIKKK